MKKIFIILIALFILFPSISFAWKWYSVTTAWVDWNSCYSPSNWTSYNCNKTESSTCTWWRTLMDNWLSKNQPRKWNPKCFIRDNTAPNINITTNQWNINDVWTKNNVELNIATSDSWAWIRYIQYRINWWINWAYTTITDNHNLSFNKEWLYYLEVVSTDKAEYDSAEWKALWSWKWNKSNTLYVIQIDKTAPILTTTSNDSWRSSWENFTLKLVDWYEWKVIREKTYECIWKPENAKWQFPSTTSWIIVWKCLWWECTNFVPNEYHCSWKCDEWYIKWDDWICYIDKIEQNCSNSSNAIPSNVYYYDKDNVIEEEKSAWASIIWKTPNSVWIDWSFNSYFNWSDYEPSLYECDYSCEWWYHDENWDCINDIKIVCCEDEPELSKSITWTNVDCSKKENINKVECTSSALCWFKKDLLWEWNKSRDTWWYSTSNDSIQYWDQWKWDLCWYESFKNSNWVTCNWGYYLIRNNIWKAINCENVQIWWYSKQSNDKKECTKKPKHSYYTSWSNRNNCNWSCEPWYEKKSWKCKEINDEDSWSWSWSWDGGGWR